MRAYRDTALARRFDRFAHRVRIARMKTTRDVCRGDELEHFLILARAFAEIGVKIDNKIH